MDRGAWWATVHGVAKSRPQLIDQAHTHTHYTSSTYLSYNWKSGGLYFLIVFINSPFCQPPTPLSLVNTNLANLTFFSPPATPHIMWDLSSLTRGSHPHPLHWKYGVLNIGTPGKYPDLFFNGFVWF